MRLLRIIVVMTVYATIWGISPEWVKGAFLGLGMISIALKVEDVEATL